jgi:hypothetical protein
MGAVGSERVSMRASGKVVTRRRKLSTMSQSPEPGDDSVLLLAKD